MKIQLMPSRAARLRYRLSGRAPKVAITFALLLGFAGVGVWQWPTLTALQSSVFATEPEVKTEVIDSTTTEEWQELVEVRASTRALYETLDLTSIDSTTIDEYLSAALRADVLVKNGSRTVDALDSAATDLSTAFSKLESAIALRDNPVDADAETSSSSASVFCTGTADITFKAQGDGNVALSVSGKDIAESVTGAAQATVTVSVESGRYTATAIAKAGVTVAAEWSGSCVAA